MTKFLTALLLVFIVAGCASAPTPASTPSSLPSALPLEPTLTPVPAATPISLSGPQIEYNNIRFTLDPALGTRLLAYEQSLTAPNGQTVHSTRFSLAPEASCQTWCIEIYPVREFEQAFGTFTFPPGASGGGAAAFFRAQEKGFTFEASNGTRGLEVFGQMSYFVSNESLKYIYRGYTPGGQFAIYVQIPIQAESLPDVTPTLPPTGDPLVAILDFNKQAAADLNALAPEKFSPNLNLLDALIETIQVQ